MDYSEYRIIHTADGSDSLIHDIFNESYHSVDGAISESKHVYIDNGFTVVAQELDSIKILEMGFGTGLNFLLTLIESIERDISVDYHTFELYPLPFSKVEEFNYFNFCSKEVYELFKKAHLAPFNQKIKLTEKFNISKYSDSFAEYQIFPPKNNLVYYDAFSFDTQPELWSSELFSRVYASMEKNAILTTYASKGIIKQNLRDAMFHVKRYKGALGKRHMVVATKF